MTPELKLEFLLKSLRLFASQKLATDDPECLSDWYCCGNDDDTYRYGVESGETNYARALLEMIGEK